jgi:hypothetical protein
MVETHDHFNKRLGLLGRKHEEMTHGYTTKIGKNGLILVKPKTKRRGFPIKGLILVALGFFAFKAFMLASVGPLTYTERLSKLENGSVVEAVGAKLLGIDPLTAVIADYAGSFLR